MSVSWPPVTLPPLACSPVCPACLQVAEQGSHNELIRKAGIYYHLVRRQHEGMAANTGTSAKTDEDSSGGAGRAVVQEDRQ